MSTKWHMKRGNAKIEYAAGKGVRAPCRCRRVFKVTLWDSRFDPNEVDDLSQFYPYFPTWTGSTLTFSPGFRRFYSITAIDENHESSYVPNVQCAPVFGDSSGAPITVNANITPLSSVPTDASAWGTTPLANATDGNNATYAETKSVASLGAHYDIGSLNGTNFSSLSQSGKTLIKIRAHCIYQNIATSGNVAGDGGADIKLERLNAFGSPTILASVHTDGSGSHGGASWEYITGWYNTTDWNDVNNARIEIRTNMGGLLGNLTRPVRVYEYWLEVQYSTNQPATFHKDYEGGAAVYSELTFPLTSAADWKYENTLKVNNSGGYYNKLMAYFLLEWTNKTKQVPSLSDLSGVLPAAFAHNSILFGVGQTDRDISPHTANCATAWNNGYTFCGSNVVPSATRQVTPTFQLPGSVAPLAACTIFVQTQVAVGSPQHKIARFNYGVIKFTDYKFYTSLSLTSWAQHGNAVSPPQLERTFGTWFIISYTDLTNTWNVTSPAISTFTNKVFRAHNDDSSIDLTSYLDHSGRDIYLYVLPETLADPSKLTSTDATLGPYPYASFGLLSPTYTSGGTP